MAANYYKYNANMNDRTYFTSVITDTAGNTKRYFSNIESEIYFGDKQMDDLYQFEFGIDEKILPIYGYNCHYATELVSGQRIVQGQFVVNYTDTMLIQNTLSQIDDSIYNQVYNEKYVPGGDLHHAIYDKAFDIMIGYGYYDIKDKQTYNATSQTILGAKISGIHKVVDTTGQPILEVFTFTAKDFVEENITQSTTGNNNNNTNDNSTTNNNNDLFKSYVCSDAYNTKQVSDNNSYIKDHDSCENFIHNITYSNGYITMSVNAGSGKKITLLSGNIEITDKLSNTVTIPVFKFDKISKTNMSVYINSKYAKLIENKRKSTNKINCSVNYTVKIATDDGTIKQYKIVYDDAIMYI
ncbi:MAG: hypothetical protein ACI3T9_02925 [Romboutsia timonensis]